jgi:hypothetical protein
MQKTKLWIQTKIKTHRAAKLERQRVARIMALWRTETRKAKTMQFLLGLPLLTLPRNTPAPNPKADAPGKTDSRPGHQKPAPKMPPTHDGGPLDHRWRLPHTIWSRCHRWLQVRAVTAQRAMALWLVRQALARAARCPGGRKA